MAGEKRSAAESEDLAYQESAILLDVEGTTSSISFVKDSLFPHVREFLKKHVNDKWETEEFKADFAKLKEQAKEDEEKKIDGFVPIKEDTEEEAKESLVKNVLWQMDNDRKTGALKQLQGHIWKAEHKPLKGHVYDDVPKAFAEWTNSGKKLYIYSSGSVEAQKLLFGKSVHGDLLKYISEHFDTEVGPKQEADSYKNILKKLNLEPSNVLFLTDIVKEAEAAKAAGLSTTIVVREGNTKLSDEDKVSFKTIESFSEIIFQSASKRQKVEKLDENGVEKKDTSEEKELVTVEPVCEPMDTSEDVAVAKDENTVETKSDIKEVESKVEKVVEEVQKSKEGEKVTENVEKVAEETLMEEDAKQEDKTVTKTEAEKTKESVSEKEVKENGEEKKETIECDKKSKTDVETEKKDVDKSEEAVKKPEKTTTPSEKVLEEKKVEVVKNVEHSEADKVMELDTKEAVTEKITQEVTEKVSEKVAETVTEAITAMLTKEVVENETEKIAEKVIEESKETEKVTDVTKPEEKDVSTEKKASDEVKENGEAKVNESEKIDEVAENKVLESEDKENVHKVDEGTKEEKPAESDIEVAEEAKETTKEMVTTKKEKETEDQSKPESETQSDTESKKLNGTTTNGDSTKGDGEEQVHSNGVSEVSEKTKENGDAEESIKVKKAVADGAGEPDVTPPVVAATS